MKEEVIIDATNPYVQGLIKVIRDFMFEEACGAAYTEDRLKTKIGNLREIFMEERKRMVLSGDLPKFGPPNPELYQMIFKQV